MNRVRSFWPSDEIESPTRLEGRVPCSLSLIPSPSGEPKRPATVPSLSTLSPKKRSDRVMMTSIRDTIQQKKPCHILRALSAYDPQRTGSLTAEALGTACSSIFGVSDEDQQKIIAKLDPNGTGSVRIIDFVSAFEHLQPLGSQSDPRIWSPWQDRSGVAMTAYNWERVAPPPTQFIAIGSGYSRKKPSTPQDESPMFGQTDSPTWRRGGETKPKMPPDVRMVAHSKDIDPVLKSLSLTDTESTSRGGQLLMTQSVDISAKGHPLMSSRFYHLKFPDTRHITTPPSSSFYSDTFIRKSDPNFSCFQREDFDRRGSHLQQSKDRFSWARAREVEIENSNTPDPEVDRKKLAVRSMAKERYAERAYLYDKAIKFDTHSIFSRG